MGKEQVRHGAGELRELAVYNRRIAGEIPNCHDPAPYCAINKDLPEWWLRKACVVLNCDCRHIKRGKGK